MPFKQSPQTFAAKINAVTVGTGDSAIAIGGENVMPLCSFDAPIENAPKIGMQVSDLGYNTELPKLAEFYAGTSTLVERAQKAASLEGVDFISISLDSADPNGNDRSIEDCVADCVAVCEALNKPVAIQGSKNVEKDQHLFEKLAEALQGKNVLLLSAREENYKAIAAAAGLAYNQKLGAESAVDINLAKQLNVLISQLGVSADAVVMNVGTAAAGYGYEYVASTMNRIKLAALEQNDQQLQMPIVTPVAGDAWSVKEAVVSEADFPEWGPAEERGVQMEISTAAASLTCGSNAVILQHPESVATISALIAALM